ncbi:DNRLRE domain-containing protein [Aeromicrobium sp. CF3.5]|uniref:DNRLRE domain-containing protein n=1 Tax=Aeromicrobium sp. CF3.5 TaxID=3373078 RepID=UPI003EE60F6F
MNGVRGGQSGALKMGLALVVSGAFVAALAMPVQPTRAEAAEDVSEFAQAADSGVPVEIEEARTATDTVYANPSGTYTREIASAPIRVRQDGEWEPVDLTLEAVDGVIRPKASPIAAELSAGGDEVLSTVEFAGVSTQTSWIDELPAPVLDGATATYREVLDGVDLRMSVTDGGVTQVLVVRDEQAARSAELAEIELPVEVDGGELIDRDGGLAVVDEVGREVGVSPAPTMWDSSGTVLADDEVAVSDSSGEAIDQRTEGPAAGDEVSPVDLEVGADDLVLMPRPDALTGPEVSYPVFIDPASSPSTYAWGMVFQQFPTTSFYKWTNSNGEGVGYQNYNGVSRKRQYFRFKIDGLKGVDVLAARLRGRMEFSSSCAMRGTRVYKVGAFDSSLTWNKQPGVYRHLATTSQVAFSGCNPGGADVSWNVTSGVQESADDRHETVALSLRAADESDPLAWRRFRHTMSLSIEYNRPPSVPTGTSINGLPCTLTKNPLLGRMTKLPQMRAVISDPDTEDSVRARIGISTGSEIVGSLGSRGRPITSNMPITRSSTGVVPSGEYRFHFRAQDNHGSIGAYAQKCKFFVDATLAAVPGLVTSLDEPLQRGESHQVLVDAGGGTDTTGYAFTVDSSTRPGAKQVPATGVDGEATVTIPPNEPGLHTLRVWAYDAANNPSEVPLEVPFEVIDSNAVWDFSFNEPSGPSLAADGTSFDVGSAQRQVRAEYITDDPDVPVIDRMLQLTPQIQGLPSLTDRLIDLSGSFTVAAYLDPAKAEAPTVGPMTAISLSDGSTPVLEVNAVPAGEGEGFEYVFRLRSADGTWRERRTDGVADDGGPGTRLVAVSYDVMTERMRLSVGSGDGAAIDVEGLELPFAPAPGTTGTWTLGSASDGSQRWNGFVDQLHLAQYKANEQQIDDLINAGHFNEECVVTTEGCQS